MGIEMNGIHSPTVAGASTFADGARGNGTERSLTQLMNDRDNLESELKALGEVLVSHGVDMNTPLLTRDGFPRSDIDVAQIRTTRARIIYLRNDYRSLMSKIERGLHLHHAALQSGSVSNNISTQPRSSSEMTGIIPEQPHAFASSALEPPFARVNSVVSGSPADAAGLLAGDEVRRFGTANWTNHARLAAVAAVVQRSEGREVLVKVKRKGEGEVVGEGREVELRLVPRRNWGGRGMLGCHLVPI